MLFFLTPIVATNFLSFAEEKSLETSPRTTSSRFDQDSLSTGSSTKNIQVDEWSKHQKETITIICQEIHEGISLHSEEGQVVVFTQLSD